MEDSLRRCCEPGCKATQSRGAYAGNGWYRVGLGFMRHACSDHADKWRAEDEAARDWEAQYSEMHSRGEQWLEAMLEQMCPAPATAESQSSIDL